jgi:hypothetical protein
MKINDFVNKYKSKFVNNFDDLNEKSQEEVEFCIRRFKEIMDNISSIQWVKGTNHDKKEGAVFISDIKKQLLQYKYLAHDLSKIPMVIVDIEFIFSFFYDRLENYEEQIKDMLK